ncbi:MAG: spore maturation protein [Candidatus Marinimicrobia bacterium]|nr:spore maturation protein [Candidatus Neomarinimicrobiota bacterium]MDD5582141.1 spore maturation protein [Candidatus Neomarinimicrobiota bacterium]
MFETILNVISTLAIPVIIVLIPLYGYRKGVKVYEVFTVGAKEGFDVAIHIIPFLVAIFAAISIFRTSGAMQVLSWIVSPLTNLIGMPAEVLPLAFMRPLSGSGALGILTELVTTHGPDSTIGRMASIMMGSTETTFYILAVYFGSVSVTNSRHAVPAGLTADLAGIISSVIITNIIFG